MADEIKYPAGFGLKYVVAWGTTGLVVHDEVSQTVIKTPLFEDCEQLVYREHEVYKCLAQPGGHEGILRYHGTVEAGIGLDYAPNGDIHTFFEAQGIPSLPNSASDGPVRLQRLLCSSIPRASSMATRRATT
jgi:hypothetical protein